MGKRAPGMWWPCAAALLGLMGSCRGSEPAAVAADTAIKASETISAEEDELLARRDALVKARERIRSQRTELAQRRQQAAADGQDTGELEAAARELMQQEEELVGQEQQLNERYRELIIQRRELVNTLAVSPQDTTAQVAARERSMAGREKDVAEREQQLAQREASMAEREKKFAERQAEMCGRAQATTIVQTVDAKGSSYTKKDVEPLLQKARSEMARKGVLRSDLPAPIQDLDQEATKAMAEGDYGRARFAASQLLGTIRSIKINKAFIQAKIARLNDHIADKGAGGRKQAQIDGLFRQATEAYGDGNFTEANRHLNKIFSLVD
jgi:DNA repair exonuclease SbcCD ATPase subunit